MALDNDSLKLAADGAEAVASAGSMGIFGSLWQKVGNSTAMVVVTVAFAVVLYWNRVDSKDATESLMQRIDAAGEERRVERKENEKIHRDSFKELVGELKDNTRALRELANKIPDGMP